MKFFEFKEAFENEGIDVISIIAFMHNDQPKLSVEFRLKGDDKHRLDGIELSAPYHMRVFALRNRKCSPTSLEMVETDSGFTCFTAEPL